MTLRQMEFFVTVCACGSISKASQQLLISQQGISKAIRELEQELNCELLSRGSGGIVLTKYGSYALEEFKFILRKTSFLSSHLETMKKTPGEVLRIGMAYGIISSLPATFLPDFTTKYPFIELVYSDFPDLKLENALGSGQCDVAVTTGLVNESLFDVELLYKEQVFLCVPSGHPFFGQNNIPMNQLCGQSFVMFSSDYQIARDFIGSCRHAGFEPKTTLISSDFNSLKELAGISKSLFIVPEHTVRDNDASFSYCPFPDPYFTWNVSFAVRKGKLLTEAILAFKSELVQHCQIKP